MHPDLRVGEDRALCAAHYSTNKYIDKVLCSAILVNHVMLSQERTMAAKFMSISCEEWRTLSDSFPTEMEVIMEMLIEAEADLCADLK